ncbi:MAG TPA: glycosyl transferase [Gemmobacter sp.]|nr:glycosyl transferase [Gemmobacter sp.]
MTAAPQTVQTIQPVQPLQALLWPEHGICTETELYMRLTGAAFFDEAGAKGPQIEFGLGGQAKFDTATNLFNFEKWRVFCGLSDLGLSLSGAGRFELIVTLTELERSGERLMNRMIELLPGQPLRISLTDRLPAAGKGLLSFTLRAAGPDRLEGAVWDTLEAPKRAPKLALSITTFKREAAVQASVARFNTFMHTTPLAEKLHLFVVDNGRSAEIAPGPHVTPIGNENLGGSGGFARGLIAAEEGGFSHCLFMDDDASVHMGALERTWAFLAYASDPATAVSGSMTMSNYRWTLWENAAIFDRSCRPRFLGTDLRKPDEVAKMELTGIGTEPHNLYGGWWFFAFPIAETGPRPFPFFVRGDDVSFSLANRFRIATLPGVICFQDADFADKESLQTLYLDLRSHIVHHLALPSMEIGCFKTLTIPAWFFLRSMMQCHYDTLAALNLATEDVLRGPDFFAENADMAERRARIAKLRVSEGYAPITGPLPRERRRFDPRSSTFWRMVMKYSLNGHLLPFFGLWGNTITLPGSLRGQLHQVWGAARITYISADGRQSFTVRHSKARALKQGLRMTCNGLKLAGRYQGLKRVWQEGYARLATTEFWRKRLGV